MQLAQCIPELEPQESPLSERDTAYPGRVAGHKRAWGRVRDLSDEPAVFRILAQNKNRGEEA